MKKDKVTTTAQAARQPKAAHAVEKNIDQMADEPVRFDYMTLITDIEIHSLAEAARNGNQSAVTALHGIAVKAANNLNALPVALRHEVAKTTEWWPVNLSWMPSWNRANLVKLPMELRLGSELNPVVDLEAVLKRGAPTNMLGSLLVTHVEECRRFGVLARRLRRKAEENDEKCMSPDDQTLLAPAFSQVRRVTAAVSSFMNYDLPSFTQERVIPEMHWTMNRAEAALGLPPLLESRDSRNAWFAFAMELVEEISGDHYEKPEFGLTGMNRKNVTNPGEVRAGIRQGIKEGFNAVIANVSAKGFIAVS